MGGGGGGVFVVPELVDVVPCAFVGGGTFDPVFVPLVVDGFGGDGWLLTDSFVGYFDLVSVFT